MTEAPSSPRGWYEACTDLSPPEVARLERVLRALPLLADVSHADLLVFARSGDAAAIVAHAAPRPVPSIYPHPQSGRIVQRGEIPPVFRILDGGREHQSISGSLVWGAPTLQEVFQIRSSDGRVVAAVASNANLLEHERLHHREPIFRAMVARVRQQGLDGRLEGAEHLGRLAEHDGVLIVSSHGIIRYMNSVAENQYRRVGYVESLLGGQISELDTNEYICFRSMERGTCLEQRIQEQDEVWIKRAIPLFPVPRSGVLGWLHPPLPTQPEGAVMFIQDITEDVRREQELKIKSAMIQEVHHRVKNNLQTVAFLLRMEARRARSGSARETLRQTIGRILSIAVVHEFLSRGDDSDISMREVCSRIISEVGGGMMDPRKIVGISLKGRNFSLPAQQATSCALVVNELLQNAVEHGFAGRDGGTIQVRLSETDASMVIEIVDDGVGLPTGFDLDSSGTLGLQIARTLVRDDLKGHLELVNGRGVTARVSFPKELCGVG